MRAALPSDIAEQIDWTTLRLEPGSVVDDQLKEAHTDLIFSAKLNEKPALLYLLLEHQSESQRFMALRLLLYIGRVWEHWLTRHPKARLLPPVIPLVVHHDERAWNAATTLSDLIDLDAGAWPGLATYMPRLCFLVDDLSRAEDSVLLARSQTAFAELGLRMLVHARHSDDFLVEMTSWVDTFQRVAAAPTGLEALATLLEYTLRVTNVPAEAVQGFAAQLGPIGNEAFMTGAQQLIETGRAEGRAELLIKLLSAKFGTLPETTRQRVRAASIEDLDRFAERILSARSLDEVFA